MKSKILEIIKDIIVPIVCAILITRFVCVFAIVPTASMKPLINENDMLIVNKIEKLYKEIERGDLIVFNAPPEVSNTKKLLIKRVIGLPGETVEIKNGIVYINNEPLEENYVENNDNRNMEKVYVPIDEYFLLGDNRSNSFDCRFWDKKTVNIKSIVGFGHLLDFKKDK